MLVLDQTQYFTRQQSDARYVRLTEVTGPPTNLTLIDSGIVTTATSETAFLSFSLTPPSVGTVISYQFQLTGGGQTFTQTLPVNGIGPYQLIDLALNVDYTISVSSIDADNQAGPYGVPSDFTTPGSTTPPIAPVISATPNASGCLITLLTANTEPDFGYYDLFRSVNADMSGEVLLASFVGLSYQDLAIPATDNYYYTVQAIDIYGNTSTSNIAGPVYLTATVLSLPPIPDILDGSITANSNGSITITWPAINYANLGFWRIYRQVNGPWSLIDTISADSNVPGTYIDFSTTGGVTYNYTVSAVNNEGGDSGFNPSNFLTATALFKPAPAAPSGLIFMGSFGSVIVNWPSSTSPDVQYYAVNYSLTLVPVWQTKDILVTSNTFTLYGLTGTRIDLTGALTFSVKAVNNELTESTAIVATVTFPDLSSYVPANVHPLPSPDPVTAIADTDGSATISWTAPNFSTIWGYRLDRLKTTGLDEWEVMATIQDSSVGPKSFIDIGLEPFSVAGAEYQYRVFTIDNTGAISSYNMVEDPGFESGLIGWDTTGIIVTTPVLGGTQSLQAAYLDATNQVIPLIGPGLEYIFSAYVQQGSMPGDSAEIRWQWLNGSMVIISQDSATIPTISSFLRVSLGPLPAPIGAEFIYIFLDGDAGVPTTTFLWDNVQFEQSAVLTPYANGVSALIEIVNVSGPEAYSNLNLTATGITNGINIQWVNPGMYDVEYNNSTFEIWRASDVGGSPGTFIELVELPGNNDGAVNSYIDDNPTFVATKYWYNLKVKDQYGIESPYLSTPVSATSLTLDLDHIPNGALYKKYLFQGEWADTVNYVPGDEVTYSGNFWLCLAPNTNIVPATGVYWQLVGPASAVDIPGSQIFIGPWSDSVPYVPGNEVSDSLGNIWLCLVANTNSEPDVLNTNWQLMGSPAASGAQTFEGDWSSIITYEPGNEVTYQGNFWLCLLSNLDSPPTVINTNWQLAGPLSLDDLANGTTFFKTLFLGDWSDIFDYLPGYEVTYQGNFWQCITANLNVPPAIGPDWILIGPETLDAIVNGTSYIKTRFLGVWDVSYETITGYIPGDEVTYPSNTAGNYYYCTTGVTSGTTPDLDTTHWQVIGPSFISKGMDTNGNLKLKNIASTTLSAVNIPPDASVITMTIDPLAAGTGYSFSEVVTATSGGGDATALIDSVGGGGVVTAITPQLGGKNYAGVTSSFTSVVGGGTGLILLLTEQVGPVAIPGSLTITTQGNDVLILGSVLVQKFYDYTYGLTLSIYRDGSSIFDFPAIMATNPSASVTTAVPIMFIDTPSAAAHTYQLYAGIPAGSGDASIGSLDNIQGGTLQLLELG